MNYNEVLNPIKMVCDFFFEGWGGGIPRLAETTLSVEFEWEGVIIFNSSTYQSYIFSNKITFRWSVH